MAIVMLKSRQDCKSHESLLNFITTFPTMTTATKKLINPVNKTCETSSLHSIRVLHLKMTQFHYLCKNQILVIYFIRFLWKITLKGIHFQFTCLRATVPSQQMRSDPIVKRPIPPSFLLLAQLNSSQLKVFLKMEGKFLLLLCKTFPGYLSVDLQGSRQKGEKHMPADLIP